MEAYTNPMIFIPIIIFLLGGIGFYVFRKINNKYPQKRREGKEEERELYSRFDPVYAQVFDNTGVKPRWYWQTIPGALVEKIFTKYETLGILQDTEDGKKAYQLVRIAKEDYKPIKYPRLKEDNPVELNYDTEHPEYEIILAEMLAAEKNFLQKYGQVLWWAAVIGFIIFMMVKG